MKMPPRVGRREGLQTRWLTLVCLAFAVSVAWPQMPHPDHLVVEVPHDRPYPSVTIELEADPVDGYNLHLVTRNFEFTPEAVNEELVPNQGHAHLFLNGVKVARLYSEWRHLPKALFEEGVNRLEVVLNANDHSTWGIAGEPIGEELLTYSGATSGSPIVYGDVSYRSSWFWGRAKAHRSGRGWRTTNDLGYEVHVRAGRVVTRNLELVPCHVPSESMSMARLWELFRPPAVHAGHASMLPNASRISKSFEDDLGDPKPREIEVRRVRDPEYCQAHLLVARPSGTAPSASSVEVSGTWKKKGGGRSSFEIDGRVSYGELKDLRALSGGEPEAQSIIGGVRVELRRRLDTLFDGVDFETMDSAAQANAVAHSLVGDAELLAN